ncbi:Nucleotidyl transferase domain [Dillenia turbinata]|uniref:Nucleotidyl transferase domain n=1 Tax=Dillenia turbinata TaxID=194707 RepID=A0AAN8YT91_9MAGN
MVLLQLSVSIPFIHKAKPSILGLLQNHREPSSLPSNAPSRLQISNSPPSESAIHICPPTLKSVAAIVFGDGSESQLYPLTKRRSVGAIPIAANYRLIDAVISNCINSNITKIYALTQFNSTSLNSHLSRAYSCTGKESYVEVIAAYQSQEDQDWFRGTADAIRRCLWILEEQPVVEFLVLPGYHLYKMDYQKLIQVHRSSKADITIVGLDAATNHDPGFGFFTVNFDNEVVESREKSEKQPVSSISVINSRNSRNNAYCSLASLGIYVINSNVMRKLLEEMPNANDFGKEVIPGAISRGMKVGAFLFDEYWEDMRSIEAFYQANMESTKETNLGYNFHDRDFPVYTLPRCLPPTQMTGAVIKDSVIGDGCILNKCKIRGTVVGMRARVGEGAIIEDTVIMGSDIYQLEDMRRSMEGKGKHIPIGIGNDSHIRRAIIDKNARIGKNVMIMNRDNVVEGNRESQGYIISGGIVIVLRGAVIPDCTII